MISDNSDVLKHTDKIEFLHGLGLIDKDGK